jgi:hypothetical protein
VVVKWAGWSGAHVTTRAAVGTAPGRMRPVGDERVGIDASSV